MRTKLAAGITVITAITIIGGAGVATAGASQGATRTEHFRIMNTEATSSRLSVIVTGAFTVDHGTGKYAGIRGSGNFVTSIVAITAKNRAGRCTHVQAPATYQEITTATGTVSR